MQEFELLVSTENGSIVTNMEGIKKNLAAGLEEYKHMVFTEESKKEAKDTQWLLGMISMIEKMDLQEIL